MYTKTYEEVSDHLLINVGVAPKVNKAEWFDKLNIECELMGWTIEDFIKETDYRVRVQKEIKEMTGSDEAPGH